MNVSGGPDTPSTPHLRKTKNPAISGAGTRRRKYRTPVWRAGHLPTPRLRWKFVDRDDKTDFSVPPAGDAYPEAGREGFRRSGGGGGVEVSARKLAAGLWQLRLTEVSSGGGGGGRGLKCGSFDRLGFEMQPGIGHLRIMFPCHHAITKELLRSPLSVSGSCSKNGALYKLESSFPYRKSAMEGATKWDPMCSKTSSDISYFCSHMKHRDDQHVTIDSVVSGLQAELVQARLRIRELEAGRRTSKKKVEHFLRKLEEEKTSWKSREQQKIHAVIGDLKDELNRERKNRQRMEILNSKLVGEISDAKISARQFMQGYKEEKKARELTEEVCNELLKAIGDNKTEVEALKRESVNICEELEEERKMLQLAEVWREERVQMKLVDAKLTLEDKYSQMTKRIKELETFLSSRSGSLDVIELRKVELIRQAAKSVNIQDIKEFSYTPPESDDIFSILEEIRQGELNKRQIEPCDNHSPASHASKIYTMSPEVNGANKSRVLNSSNVIVDNDRSLEEAASGWETASRGSNQDSTNSLKEIDPSTNRICRSRNVSMSGSDLDENAGPDSSSTENSEVSLLSIKQLNLKASPVSNVWRSHPNNGGIDKVFSDDQGNGRLSNGTISSAGIISPNMALGDSGVKHQDSLGQWNSKYSGNPGMKGGIEWPPAQKGSLKEKLLEARMECQKTQSCHILKRKS